MSHKPQVSCIPRITDENRNVLFSVTAGVPGKTRPFVQVETSQYQNEEFIFYAVISSIFRFPRFFDFVLILYFKAKFAWVESGLISLNI
jgi:hypothetical protein